MFAAAPWTETHGVWVNVNSHPYNQSPSVALCGPCSRHGREHWYTQYINAIRSIYIIFVHLHHYHWAGAGASQSGLSAREPHSSREGRAKGVCLFSTHTHTHTRSGRYADTSRGPSLRCILYFLFFFPACSPDVVSSSSPRSFAPLGSPARRLVTAPNRIRSTARLDIHDLSIHQWREGERDGERERERERERNGCLSVKSEIETRGEGEKLEWSAICKRKQRAGKNIFKVRHVQKYNYILTQHANMQISNLMTRFMYEWTVLSVQWSLDPCFSSLLLVSNVISDNVLLWTSGPAGGSVSPQTAVHAPPWKMKDSFRLHLCLCVSVPHHLSRAEGLAGDAESPLQAPPPIHTHTHTHIHTPLSLPILWTEWAGTRALWPL